MKADDLKQRFPGLQGVAQNDLEVLLDAVKVTEITADTKIIVPGKESDTLYMIYDGLVQVSLESDTGHWVLGEFGRGQWIGDMGMIHPAIAVASVTTIEDSTMIQLAHSDFMALRRRCPALTSVLLQMLSSDLTERLRSTMQFVDSEEAGSQAEETKHAWLVETAKRLMGIAARAGA